MAQLRLRSCYAAIIRLIIFFATVAG